MLIKPAGERLWVGPIFTPGMTGCWECLAHRLRENRWTEDVTKASAPAIFELAAKQVKSWKLAGLIQELTPAGELLETHTLARRPQCIACGGKLKQTVRELRLQSRNKIIGGARTCSAQDTVARLARHESNLTGIVARVRQAPDWQALPTYLGEHCRPLPLGWPHEQLRPAPQPVAGKGASEDDARASCLAEAMERYCIQWQGDEPRRLARRSELGKTAIGFKELALWSEAQLAGRERWNRKQGGFNLIPELPPDDAEIEWTPVWSLTELRRKYVPTSYCYLYYPGMIYLADSNGCAAGNTIEEAIAQAFLELVERDAVGIWWYNRLRCPPVKVEGQMKESYVKVRRELANRGRTLAVLDLTTDFEIPVFAALSTRQNGRGILIGTGAHLNAGVALNRALGELCQVVESLGNGIGRRHGRLTTVEQPLDRWLRNQPLARHPHLVPHGARKPLGQFHDWSKSDVKEEVEWCVRQAQSLGLELLVLEMTRADIGFPVARVIMPGIRHCWGRFAPGRLYDVPVKMGYSARARREPELNPIAYFL
jgi:ribosomal protein S12 methylthiotransferase accessory factor